MYTFNKNVNEKMKGMMLDCINKCKAIDIPISEDIDFQTDTAERRNGGCKHLHCGGHVITISRLLTDDKEIENTIFHELLHTCVNCNNHGYLWRSYGYMVERAYGQHIQRCTNKQRVAVDVKSSRRKYFSEEEWKANPEILVAYTREGESRPIWFVKRGSQTETRLGYCTSFGKKIVKFA